jgi:hypothetical protein
MSFLQRPACPLRKWKLVEIRIMDEMPSQAIHDPGIHVKERKNK